MSVDLLLEHKLSLTLVVIIFVVKFLVTPFCFGSGAAGGIFLPMLMLGAFLGYIIASIFNFFGLYVDPIIISMIGMGAFLSAVARTPITAVVMVFEMTAGYSYILPIMLSAAVADLVAEKLNHRPIYSTLIVNQLKTDEAKTLSALNVEKYMVEKPVVLFSDISIKEAIEKVNVDNYNSYPVINRS